MLISLDIAQTVFKKVKHVREEYAQYVLGGATNVLSVEDLQSIISQMYGVKIVKTQVAFEAEHVRGNMERWPDEVRIRIRQDQTEEWKRFTAVKELCHVFIDEKEDWSVNVVGTINDLLQEYTLQDGDTAAARVSQSEILAELAAVELMYPFECRAGDLRRLTANDTTNVKIATFHRMPAVLIARALSEQYYKDIAQPLWDAIERG